VAHGFRRVPVQAEVPPCNGEIGGDSQFFASAGPDQGAIVANAEAQLVRGDASGPTPNTGEQGQLTLPISLSRYLLSAVHMLRIGETADSVNDGEVAERLGPIWENQGFGFSFGHHRASE
jgi:hypothetical protein